MKIIHIIPNLRKGGAEKLVLDIVKFLGMIEGNEVYLIVLKNEIEYPIDDLKHIIKIIPASVQLSLFRKNKFNNKDLQNFIDDFKPDIVHSHLFYAEIVSRSCTYTKAKWFSHFHDNMKQFENFNIKNIFNRKLLLNYFEKKFLFKQYQKNNGNHFIAISNDTLNFAKSTCNGYPFSLLPNAIDISIYKRKKEIPNDIIRIINIGSFVAKKNQLFFIEIANILRAKKYAFEIVLLGDGIMYELVKNKIIENNLVEYFKMPGAVSNVNEYLNNANLYVHTATSEPFGLVLIEAMAARLPVISLDGKGNRDLIEEGKNGYMIYEEKPDLFVDKILSLFNHKDHYNTISNYAELFSMKYDMLPYIHKLVDLYEQ